LAKYPLFYWGREKGAAEIDFIMQYDDKIIPIEVKSEKHTQAKSLQVYNQLYKPKIAIKTSVRNFRQEGNLFSVPLYIIGSLQEIITFTQP